MKPNSSLLKLIIRLLILLILFVLLFFLSAFLYSARYWPDIYNYVNANVTIKRIPTLSELNLTIIEVDEFTTDDNYNYSTTDNYANTDTTIVEDEYELDFDEFTALNEDFTEPKRRVKRKIKIEETNKDYSLLPDKGVVDYFFDYDETTKVMKDLIDENKLTTISNMEDVEIVPEINVENYGKFNQIMLPRSCDGNSTESVISEVVFPWIAAIFIKNDASNQFDYYCDGALLSERTVLTGARCVDGPNGTLQADNILIVLGKRSLQSTNENETAYKVKQIKVHENFTKDTQDDLAILVLEGRVSFNDAVNVACVSDEHIENNITEAATTGWRITGELTPIYFENEGSKRCERNTNAENTFCAVYGNQVTVCPSFGGMYVAKHTSSSWYLQGILTGDPAVRGICISKTVTYTSLKNYNQWIKQSIDIK